MLKEKIVIIGGVAGGATLASRLRRLSEEYEIILFEKDEYVAFANCGLPYYIGDVIGDRNKLLVQTVEGLEQRYNLDIRNFSEVIAINDKEKTVSVKNHKDGSSYEESYDKLVLSPGATPIVPPFDGLKTATNVFTLRNIPDADKVKSYIHTKKPKNAVIIGGGFIGVEMAENLAHLGMNVTLIDLADHILKPFDIEMASELELNLKANGVNILINEEVANVQQDKVTLKSGTIINTELTIIAIGVRPASKIIQGTNIELTQNGSIKVNERLETTVPNIYAIGDVISIINPIINEQMYIPLAWPANRQARLLGDIISGQDKKYKGTIGASVLKVNNLTAASVGVTEEQLQTTNIKYNSVIVNRGSRAGYYPNGSNMNLKLIFALDGKILGAQAIGSDGVEKRIDVISTAIQTKATVYDLEHIEVCYAPPFNSAKDPVNIAGYAAVNILNESAKSFKYNEVEEVISNNNKILIDVRTKEEFEFNNIKGAINIDLDTIRSNIDKLNEYKSKKIYIYCQVGLRGYIAQRILENNGFDTYNLSGGFNTYSIYNKNINSREITYSSL